MSSDVTSICRCERVSTEMVDEAIAEGNLTVNDIKRRTRAGMGVCQGIYCVGEIAHRLVTAGVESGSIEPMTSRPPTRLLPLRIAATDSGIPEK